MILFLICVMITSMSLIVEAGDSITLYDSEGNDLIELQEPVAVTVTDYVEILKNDVMTITPVLTPINAITQFSFFSSDETIVKVVSSGIGYTFNILAVNEGRATITIKTENGLTAECIVCVIGSPDPLNISIEDCEIHQGESRYIYVDVEPKNAIIQFENITSEDYSIATAFMGGWTSSVGVHGVNAGSTTITVTTANGLETSFQLTVIPSPDPETIEIPEVYTMKEGETWDIPIHITPQEAYTIFDAYSENNDIAIARPTGASDGCRVFGFTAGIADISVTTENGLTAICKVTVEHDWEDEIITIEATSEHGEGLVRRCKVCGHLSCIDAHEEVGDPAISPTCTETGLTEGKHCAICGEVLIAQKTIEELPYTEEKVEGKPATCTENGLTDGTKCSVCGEILVAQEEIPAKGHYPDSAVTENSVETTCTKDGSYDEVVYCSVCKTELSRETKIISALGHTWDEGVIIKQPTIKEAGIKTYTCKVCGTTKTETIPKLTDVKIGDLNNDGKINQKDLAMLSKYMRNPTANPLSELALLAADINGDNTVNQKDLAILSKYLRNPIVYPLS